MSLTCIHPPSGYCSYGWSEISTSQQQLVSDGAGGGSTNLGGTLNSNHPSRQGPKPTVGGGGALEKDQDQEEGLVSPVHCSGPGDHTLAKTALIVKTGESSAPVQSGEANKEQENKESAEEGEFETVEVKEELRVQRCRYCNKTYDFGEEVPQDELCPSAPNKLRESIDRFICIQCYKGAWYHLTKDVLEEEGQDIGRCRPGQGMTTGHWCLLGMLSVVCAPCLVLWCPLSACELAAQQAGVTGGPHNMTTIKKKTTMIPTKRKKEPSANSTSPATVPPAEQQPPAAESQQ
eukprot:sb/3467614/